MAGKAGRKPAGRKPASVRRQSDLTDGAFGRENAGRVAGKRRATQLDKSISKKLASRSGGAA